MPGYFEIFQIHPPRLSLDAEQLEKTFYRLSLELHPDRNFQDPLSQQKAADLNQAYRSLKDIWSRASYIVEQNGVAASKKIPQTLAEFYFELQDAEDPGALAGLRTRLKVEQERRKAALLVAFKTFDHAQSEAAKADVLLHIQSLFTENKYAKALLADIDARATLAI